ncbi:MAG: glutathione S-transferase family protein [Granulosicoccaceae bacterium]
MKLYYATASPFVRKVRMAAQELNLTDNIELVEALVLPGKENSEYANRVNPLRKIPALQIDDGSVILDSTVICEYLNDLHGQQQLIPASGPEKWLVQTAHAMASGIMEAAVSIRYETFLRPEPQRWPVWIDEQWEKINNTLGWFNKRNNSDNMSIDNIALACALGYLDFRSPEFAWRDDFSKLAAWHGKVSQNASYIATTPK